MVKRTYAFAGNLAPAHLVVGMHDHPNPVELAPDGVVTRLGLHPGIPLAHHETGQQATLSVSKGAPELGFAVEPEKTLETWVAVVAVAAAELEKMLVTWASAEPAEAHIGFDAVPRQRSEPEGCLKSQCLKSPQRRSVLQCSHRPLLGLQLVSLVEREIPLKLLLWMSRRSSQSDRAS